MRLLIAMLCAFLCLSCWGGTAAVTELPSPTDDDRPPGSMPELPRVAVELPPANASTVPTRTLSSGDDLQAALEDAKPGDVLALQAGAVFKGAITLPAKDGSDWITIRTSTPDNVFPTAGTRVTPADAPRMPIIESDGAVAITTEAGAHHYRFIGIEIRPKAATFVFNLVLFGNDVASVDALPHHIVFERCYIHGDPIVGARRGIAMNSAHTAVIDSYLSDFKENGNDSQALSSWNGPGPFLIVNNHLEGAGENIMFGGADPDITNLVPSDIEIRGNEVVKPLSWKTGTEWTVKNLLELKNARRVLIDSNTFENNWLQAQNGFAVLFTPRNQEGGSPWSMVRDITFTHNIVRHAGSAINILGTDDLHPSQQTKRILIANNVFDDIDGDRWGGSGRFLQVLSGTMDVVVQHNTAFQSGEVIMAEGDPNTGFIYCNNLTPNNLYGVAGDNTAGHPIDTLSRYFPSASFVKNVLIGADSTLYPGDNFFPASSAAVHFVNAAAGDYRLAADSPYKNAGSDGKDVGALLTDQTAPIRRRAVH